MPQHVTHNAPVLAISAGSPADEVSPLDLTVVPNLEEDASSSDISCSNMAFSFNSTPSLALMVRAE